MTRTIAAKGPDLGEMTIQEIFLYFADSYDKFGWIDWLALIEYQHKINDIIEDGRARAIARRPRLVVDN